ncbi:glycogen-debranching protein [Puniceibacterium antarcticum]|uniref:Glycogen-debranching protein n=1 Tax=Puniceibacterium antarcticum TaxID=1206336 RepID=A0A2G8RJH1_9RHOB|nr:amylo-alpha-1,6-glucosidase [Puniceibacterium antarcticum]PIL21746.1 glycogen-debranching protein [Puniceibacterium antarcticum]
MFADKVMKNADLPGDRLGRDICAMPGSAQAAEWIVTNGIGGYAAGTIAGLPTRGYHGLLVAALDPPVGRTLMLVTLLETVIVGDQIVDLGTIRWADGTVAPDGANRLEEVRFEGTLPVWRYVTPHFTLEKRVFMDHGANVTRIHYACLRADAPLSLTLRPIADCRDYHSRSFAADWLPDVTAQGDRIIVAWGCAERRMHLHVPGAKATASAAWYRDFDLAQERARGLTDREDHVQTGAFEVTMRAGETLRFTASADAPPPDTAPDMLIAEFARQHSVLSAWDKARPSGPPAPFWIRRLVLSADQFIARRTLRDGSAGHTIIAGYHWFADWGRDTMISLPGLAIETGRTDIAASILRSFAEVVDGGMIPNRFPDGGTAPEYNTVDASFWFIEAVSAHFEATADVALLAELFGVLEDIVQHMQHGTRYGIRVDPADGLIRAGEAGVQLTWMDAKVGDWVVTPRIGKPVEVNALWISGLRFMARSARLLERDPAPYEALLAQAVAGFERFWNEDRGFCFDVLDGPDGHEDALRPNQIFAARAATGVFEPNRCRQILRRCEESLLTPAGLRSLAPGEPGYSPHYGGDQMARDGAYHQGTVWAWLIGPFLEAHLHAFADPVRAAEILAPMADQLRIEGIGTINEIFEADGPHAPRGCVAQAWSVAECIRAWHLIARATASPLKT